jgi:hypothetical protein
LIVDEAFEVWWRIYLYLMISADELQAELIGLNIYFEAPELFNGSLVEHALI